jgi:5-formyltetrahydrofolate cyclo-ligase
MAKFRRIAIAMDMNPDTHPRELVEEYLRRRRKVIKPVVVNDGWIDRACLLAFTFLV